MKTKITSILFITTLGFSLASLTGCASIVDGTQQSVSITTTPVTAAQCALSNNKGQWYVNTPGSVMVHRSFDDLHILCRKQGYEDGNATVKSTTKAMAFGNVLFGGAIGAGVDVADGAAYHYPPTIQVPMRALN